MTLHLVKNVHNGIQLPPDVHTVAMVTGDYLYYHYRCDGFDDRGWGCGYRTLQTLCSWVRIKQLKMGKESRKEPTNQEIQEALVTMQDKPAEFLGSKQWIGAFEVCLCLDYFYDVSSKIIHVTSGDDIESKIPELFNHFKNIGSPIMMGGDTDTSSKGVLGICQSLDKTYLLTLDPHFYGNPNISILQDELWVKWRPLESFMTESFYNLCLPQFVDS
ncbi:ufm1-specific protease 1-like [Saccoglossus kowalevskii]|uniref:Ufm1-specific protease 1-like n=1 Tax=Saccoglossus kowalevskii TaxID=10224 RepID=A0ABM0MX23_SACKO|nr:PREDICTED: ufm1-specific protease 1-like [Saccoglossus kowalevskii]